MNFKYPPANPMEKKISTTIGITTKDRDMLNELGYGNITLGVRTLIFNNEEKIKKFIELKNNKQKKQKKQKEVVNENE